MQILTARPSYLLSTPAPRDEREMSTSTSVNIIGYVPPVSLHFRPARLYSCRTGFFLIPIFNFFRPQSFPQQLNVLKIPSHLIERPVVGISAISQQVQAESEIIHKARSRKARSFYQVVTNRIQNKVKGNRTFFKTTKANTSTRHRLSAFERKSLTVVLTIFRLSG